MHGAEQAFICFPKNLKVLWVVYSSSLDSLSQAQLSEQYAVDVHFASISKGHEVHDHHLDFHTPGSNIGMSFDKCGAPSTETA